MEGRGRAEGVPRKAVGFKASAEEKARWTAKARSAGKPLNTWLRELADAASLAGTGGVKPPRDPAFVAAVDRAVELLGAVHADRDQALRIAVHRLVAGLEAHGLAFLAGTDASGKAKKK